MPSLRDYFLTESGEYLDRLDRIASENQADSGELLRTARALRGAAQMAREERVRRVASALEVAARELARGTRQWDEDAWRRVRDTVADLRTLSQVGEGDAGASVVAEHALARWREVGIAPEQATLPEAGADAGASDDELRQYVATEARQVVTELERAIPALTRSPMGRDPLKSILRRQRALLGAAGLERYPVVSSALRAIEDATRIVARQNVAVEGDWLALYRQAHAVLAEAVPRIEAGGRGDSTSEVYAQLRSLRDRLVGSKADEASSHPAASPPGTEPVELVGFFTTEANKLVDRVERMAGAFAAATEDRRTQLRADLRDALNALRDTSRTFGFEEPARAAEQALSRLAEAASTTLLGTVERLREVIQTTSESVVSGARQPGATTLAGGGPASAPADSPDPAGAPAPAAVAPVAATEAVAGSSPEPRSGTGAGAEAVVPIDDLLYRGDAALRRALELRGEIERSVSAEDRAARESLEELFDLVRLAMS